MCVGLRASVEPLIDHRAGISFPVALAGIPRAAEPSWVRMSLGCALCRVDEAARFSRMTHHSGKLAPSEFPAPVPIETTRSAVLARRASTPHRAHRLVPCDQRGE